MVNLTLISSPALHPHLLVNPPPAKAGCRYHLSLSFPDSLFVDRDEIKDVWDKGDDLAWTLLPSKIDIERPVRDDQEEAVRLYLEIGPAVRSLDIPLHARYLRPNSVGREEALLFDRDTVKEAWACGGATAPRPSLTTVPHGSLSLSLPTGNTSHEALVMLVTPIVIWLGWTYLARKIKGLHRRVDAATTKSKTA